MIRKFLRMFVVLFFVSQGMQAQTVSLDQVQANPGDVSVTLNMNEFTDNLGAITLFITYDSSLIDYTGFTNVALDGQWIINYNPNSGKLGLTWTTNDIFNGTPAPADGQILDLKFKYKGGFATDLHFITNECEITYGLSVISGITYNDGSISPLANNNKIILGSGSAAVGQSVSIPLKMKGAGFDQVSAFSYNIAYDKEVLSFAQLTEQTLGGAPITVSSNSNGTLKIDWTGLNPVSFIDAELFQIVFTYKGGSTDVKFMPGTEITNAIIQPIPFTPVNGSVGQVQTDASLTISTVEGFLGEIVELPVVAADFGSSEIGAFTLKINYDNSRLEYDSYTADQNINWVVADDHVNGQLNFQATISSSLIVTNGNLFTLKFKYINEGNAPVTFQAAGSSVALSNGSSFPVDLNDGMVTQGADRINTIAGGNWNEPSNWSLNMVPNMYHHVIVAEGENTIIDGLTQAVAKTIVINEKGRLSIGNTASLGVVGTFVIESGANGNGSFINQGTLTLGTPIVAKMYATASQWHGIAPSIKDQVANALYLGGNPDVWIKTYNETTAAYEPTQGDVNLPLGDMKGWMMWVGGTEPQTFAFQGALRSGVVQPSENLTRTNAGADYGHNFVGNPFTSAIDWDAISGWTKTNIANAIQVYNNGNFASYVNGVSTNGGSRYIAMNQGFFVQVVEGQTSGVLKATNEIQVHQNVPFRAPKHSGAFKLQVVDGALKDELAIVINESATEEFDNEFDAVKMFSFNVNHPQIYAVDKNNTQLSINTIPVKDVIQVDVKGVDNHMMIIKSIDTEDFEYITLVDKVEDVSVDIKNNHYEFFYNDESADRFEINFRPISNTPDSNVALANVYADNGVLYVTNMNSKPIDVYVYNLLGQVIATDKAAHDTQLNINEVGTYLVRVTDGTHTQIKKVIVK